MQYQKVSPENRQTSNNIQTEKVIFIHVSTINDKRGHELEREQGGVYWRCGGLKENGPVVGYLMAL